MHLVQARWLGLALVWLLSSDLYAWQLETQFHEGRTPRPKQMFYPQQRFSPGRTGLESVARRFLREQRARLGLSSSAALPQLIETRRSLLGTHFRFQQRLGDLPIDKAQLIISVLPNGRIFQVYNQLVNLPAPRSGAQISLDEAYDRAWEALDVAGSLFQSPRAQLLYRVVEGSLVPIYQVELSTTAPFGVWQIAVDAVSGAIRERRDVRISHRPQSEPPSLAAKRSDLPRVDRREAFAAWATRERSQESALRLRPRDLSQGRAQIFDPDPRSSLNRRDLEDDSAASDFFGAYETRILPEISFDGEAYRLAGPWAKIVDFAPPETQPTLSRDGSWNFQRGEMGFNEAMSFFHIDQNQRYLQSLGFRGARGIQQAPIEIDVNGAGDEELDNSYYDPTSNRLAFGRGCVDDSEDADVILHEYGHAIQLDINPAWSGGDTGAIGEGFGDYWAASYSLSTAGGSLFHPEEVFSWDGQGTGRCWQGRVLNAKAARYDHSREYGAHVFIEGGFQSDELWSTPLFQALLSLRAQGIPREELDRIVVEAQFGLGAGVKMRDLAQATVAVAELLYPEGPHAAVLREKFGQHDILRIPRPELAMSLISTSDSGGNGVLDPAEEQTLVLRVENKGDRAAQAIELKISSTDPEVQPRPETVLIPALEAGSSTEVLLSFRVADAALCGAILKYQVELTREGEPDGILPFETRLGRSQDFKIEALVDARIPDASAVGLSSVLELPDLGFASERLQIGLDLRHSYLGDLKLTLTSPGGKRVILHDHSGYSADDLVGVYPLTLSSKDPLSSLVGEKLSGNWELKAEDDSPGDEGRLVSWSLSDATGYLCQ